jgi:HSP20 family molecular chaperone IbpA
MEATQKEVVEQNGAEHSKPHRLYVPRTDIYESKEHLVLLADMPGVKPDSVDITLEQNVLTVYGGVEAPVFDGYSLTHAEYGVGDYRRVFTLSNEIDRDSIQASVKNGVLKLVLPKSKRAVPKKISVKTE